jgi:hypothetical protein
VFAEQLVFASFDWQNSSIKADQNFSENYIVLKAYREINRKYEVLIVFILRTFDRLFQPCVGSMQFKVHELALNPYELLRDYYIIVSSRN